MIKFKSFSSGSCGNCYFLGSSPEDGVTAGILIDAGVSPRRVNASLLCDGLTSDSFSSILVSHDHWDHIRSIGSYCKRLPRPIWVSAELSGSLVHHPGTGEYLPPLMHRMSDGWNEIVPGRIRARCFEVPHDASHTVGFAIMIDGHRYVHITDCGRMTQEAVDWCRQADTVVIESNYDVEMLAAGPYPPDLQARIRGGHGHMSNDECAGAVREFNHDGLKNVFLCHLSEHNNTPSLALETVRKELRPDQRLIALPRETPSPMFIL